MSPDGAGTGGRPGSCGGYSNYMYYVCYNAEQLRECAPSSEVSPGSGGEGGEGGGASEPQLSCPTELPRACLGFPSGSPSSENICCYTYSNCE